MSSDFEHLFQTAMGENHIPYAYQANLASSPWPHIVEIPTGLGKTAAIVLSWIYKRLTGDPDTPRRLIYCLPMRVLVEQTAENARLWIKRVANSSHAPADWDLKIYILKGGEIDNDWDKYPEEEAIIVGTQDQLLSRALNRGYSMSRFRWPMDFGYLNNDCLWVMDEVQLMGAGLATTAQLQAFRETLGTMAPVHSIWMSATLQKEWLKTIDFQPFASDLKELKLSSKDRAQPEVQKLTQARKPLKRANDIPHNKPGEYVELVIENHQRGTRTLVVVNTVKRATDIYQALKSKKPEADLALLHSRFRSADRETALNRVLAEPSERGSICVCTQVVEAGVDLSATTLITDLAPWSSLVQRFGRCNRYGIDDHSKVICVKIDLAKKGSALPYSDKELEKAAEILESLEDVASHNLPPVHLPVNYKHILRKKDLRDLFDTTPDLAGMDIDISRFIREADNFDVQVFWRNPPADDDKVVPLVPSHHELCNIPVTALKTVKGLDILSWDHLEKRWAVPASIRPGMRLMLPTSAGCYSPELGWTGKKSDKPEALDGGTSKYEGDDDDLFAFTVTGRQTLREHTNEVVRCLNSILQKCVLENEEMKRSLLLAACWHDAGKAHPVFQAAIVGKEATEKERSEIWAKSDGSQIKYSRKGFRHELASALAMLENGLPDLAVYLAAAHHGKVRLSIRSLPHESAPADPSVRFARGIWEGDRLCGAKLNADHGMPPTTIDLSYMDFGDGPKGPSWVSRMLNLRDDENHGPFRLAYLEGLLRSADWRASTTI